MESKNDLGVFMNSLNQGLLMNGMLDEVIKDFNDVLDCVSDQRDALIDLKKAKYEDHLNRYGWVKGRVFVEGDEFPFEGVYTKEDVIRFNESYDIECAYDSLVTKTFFIDVLSTSFEKSDFLTLGVSASTHENTYDPLKLLRLDMENKIREFGL